jgi:hypothetical protein
MMAKRTANLAHKLGALVALALMLYSSAAHAADDASKRALVLAKALSYERRLSESHGGKVTVATLYAAGDARSQADANRWVQGFQALGAIQVHGVPVESLAIAYDAARLPDLIRSRGIDVLLACEGTPLAAIASLARQQRVLSAADTRDAVVSDLSIGVFVSKGKPIITINVRVAKSEGAEFSAKLLQLAEVL